MNNKAVSISIQTMVIAALALLVLVVLIAVFTNQIGVFKQSTTACTEKGYSCETQCGENQRFIRTSGCGKGKVCCAPEDELIG